MRIESSVTSISWIPSEAVEGLPKLPFTLGVAHYDSPPPDRVDNIDTMHRADLFREANELKAWVEVEDGKIRRGRVYTDVPAHDGVDMDDFVRRLNPD